MDVDAAISPALLWRTNKAMRVSAWNNAWPFMLSPWPHLSNDEDKEDANQLFSIPRQFQTDDTRMPRFPAQSPKTVI